jgi:hypothetical protein
VELSDAEPPIRDYDGSAEGHGEALIVYRRVARIYKQTGPREDERMKVAQAEGSCSSREKKYRYRNSARLCPECGKPAIIKGKSEYGGGWVCFKKKDGCGAKWSDGAPEIEKQDAGQVPNTEIADVENTILKMADKRALVAATLLATGCSDIFTMDLEDQEEPHYEPPSRPVPASSGRTKPQGGQSAVHDPTSPAGAEGGPKEATPAELLQARSKINALVTGDAILMPLEIEETIVSVLGPGVPLDKVTDLDALRAVYKALNDKKKQASSEVPIG